jgi:hypothetical protein
MRHMGEKEEKTGMREGFVGRTTSDCRGTAISLHRNVCGSAAKLTRWAGGAGRIMWRLAPSGNEHKH